MIIRASAFILLFILMFSCNTENKKKVDVNIQEPKVLTTEEIVESFDIQYQLSVNPMMDIPFSSYVKEGEGQYSVLYIPKTKEIRERYKDFDKKNDIQLSVGADGSEYYSEESLKRINQIIRKDLAIQDFCIIGRFIPYYFLYKDAASTSSEYSVTIPCEMHIYKLIGNEWKFVEAAKILDISSLGKYETLSTYNDFLNISNQ